MLVYVNHLPQHHLPFDFENMFDGIWACASLLHVSSKDLNFVFKKCSKALKKNGIIYASFKYGEFEGERNGRYFLDLNESTINNYLKGTNLKIKEYIITEDVRPDNSTKWLNVILANKWFLSMSNIKKNYIQLQVNR